jgi:hypothetical protein
MYGYASGIKLSPEDVNDMKEIRRIALIAQRFRTLIKDPKGEWGEEITEHM